MCLINNCNDKSYIGSYIGETGRLLKFRINERKKAVLKEDISNSAMAAHFKLYTPILQLVIELVVEVDFFILFSTELN